MGNQQLKTPLSLASSNHYETIKTHYADALNLFLHVLKRYDECFHFVSARDETASDTDSSECAFSAFIWRVVIGVPRYLR